MSLTVTPTPRIFSYLGLSLPDINPQLPPDEIKAAYSHQYPELTTAAITGPELVGNKLQYTFSKSIGTKG